MNAVQRWCIIAAALIVGAGALVAWRALPVADEQISAADLLTRVEGSSGAAYSGYVESVGTLQLPVADQFTDIGDLFGQRTRMRVWWRDGDQWRVDKLLAAGETDLIHRGDSTVEWSYESSKAKRYVDPDIRLPRTADLLPPALGHRVLEDVEVDEVSRLPARSVAGHDALGLRVSPGSSQSSIDHVDLWVEPESGIPLRLEVYDAPDQPAAFTTAFQSFSATTPSVTDVSFTPPPEADVSFDDVLDIADAANQYADVVAPKSLAGLSKSADSRRAVGVYGTGVTQVIAIPLWDRAAEPLREQLALTPGSVALAEGTYLRVGPLGLLLTELRGGAGWLVSGTVTQETLETAARTLDAHVEGADDPDDILTKRYGSITAVDGIDLDVREGDIYGFLGANGSGKTTTVRMLLGLVLATSGTAEVMGETMPAAARRVLPRVGALVEGPAAYPQLSGRANLALFDSMGTAGSRRTRARRVDDVLEQVGLGGVDKRPVRAYSLGMRQRLGLANALLAKPGLLILDEPTNGLDPQGIREIRGLLLELHAAGTTIFLSSHLLAEVEQLCTRIGVLDRGRVVLQDQLVDLQQPTGRIFVRTPDVARARALLDGQVESHDTDSLLVRVSDAAALNSRLVGAGIRVQVLAPERHSLEDVVLAATEASPDRVEQR